MTRRSSAQVPRQKWPYQDWDLGHSWRILPNHVAKFKRPLLLRIQSFHRWVPLTSPAVIEPAPCLSCWEFFTLQVQSMLPLFAPLILQLHLPWPSLPCSPSKLPGLGTCNSSSQLPSTAGPGLCLCVPPLGPSTDEWWNYYKSTRHYFALPEGKFGLFPSHIHFPQYRQ